MYRLFNSKLMLLSIDMGWTVNLIMTRQLLDDKNEPINLASDYLKVKFSNSCCQKFFLFLNLFQACLKDRSVQEGSIATFFMYSEIQTMSFGKPTEIFTFPLNGLSRQVKTLNEEIAWVTMKNIIAGQGEEKAQVQVSLTKEMENLRGKGIFTSIRESTFLRGPKVVGEDDHTVRRKEDRVVTGAGHGVVAEVPLGQGVEAKGDPAVEKKIVEFFFWRTIFQVACVD